MKDWPVEMFSWCSLHIWNHCQHWKVTIFYIKNINFWHLEKLENVQHWANNSRWQWVAELRSSSPLGTYCPVSHRPHTSLWCSRHGGPLTMFVLVFVCTWPVHSLILTSWVLSALQLRSLIYIELLFISKTCLHVCLYSILGMECHPIAYLENVYPSFMTQLKPHLCCEVFLNLCKQSWGFPPLNSCIEANATPLSFTYWMIIVHLYVWFCY